MRWRARGARCWGWRLRRPARGGGIERGACRYGIGIVADDGGFSIVVERRATGGTEACLGRILYAAGGAEHGKAGFYHCLRMTGELHDFAIGLRRMVAPASYRLRR